MTEAIALPLNLSSLLSSLDALKLELLPLSDHFAAKCDEHSRETYGTLLAAVLLSGGEISAEQSRLFKLLLGSLKLGDIQTQLFEWAQALNLNALREFFRVARENKLSTSFFMDALVLCRLSGPLADAQHQLLSELADLLKLPEADLPVIAGLAAAALGLPCEVDIPSSFERATVSAWEEFLFRTLTADRLAAGVLRGWWLVAEPIKVNVAWNMDNARLRFTGEGSLISDTEGYISISRSHLERPIIELSGKLEFNLRESFVDGVYEEHTQKTAMRFDSVIKASFIKTKFQTIHARSIWLNKTASEFSECHFVECGNFSCSGGAVYAISILCVHINGHHNYFPSHGIYINYCSFVACIGRVGGGVYVTGLGVDSIANSSFVECRAAYQPEIILDDLNTYVFGGGAIFALYSIDKSINKCNFKNTTINIGDVGIYNAIPIFTNSVFNDSCVSARRIYAGNKWEENCTFNNKFYKSSLLITPALNQKWWSEFK